MAELVGDGMFLQGVGFGLPQDRQGMAAWAWLAVSSLQLSGAQTTMFVHGKVGACLVGCCRADWVLLVTLLQGPFMLSLGPGVRYL